jgi:hypothetical protein
MILATRSKIRAEIALRIQVQLLVHLREDVTNSALFLGKENEYIEY